MVLLGNTVGCVLPWQHYVAGSGCSTSIPGNIYYLVPFSVGQFTLAFGILFRARIF